MNLKEYIKSLVHQQLDEMSTTVGVSGFLSKNFLNPGGKNKATKAAEKQGFTAIHENMSKEEALKQIRNLLSHTIKHDKLEGTFNSWFEKVKAGDDEILDKMWTLTSKATDKHAINVLSKINESGFDQRSKFQNAKYPYNDMYGGPSSATKGGGYYAANENMNESLINIVKEELLNEVTYHKFKNEVKFRTKNEQLHKAIREVKRKLSEIDRIVEYTSRMKQELSEGEEGLQYWKKTESNIATISEMVNALNNKIKNLH